MFQTLQNIRLERIFKKLFHFIMKNLTNISQQRNRIRLKNLIDPSKISWTRGWKERFDRRVPLDFNSKSIREALYRPFFREWVYLDNSLIEVMSQLPKYFPPQVKNTVLWITGVGATVPFSMWISDSICGLATRPCRSSTFPSLTLRASR